jgi:cytosine deaminase
MDPKIARITLGSAIEQAEKSWNEGGIPIGAALSKSDGTIIALGHNQRVQTGDTTAHAETVCFRNAGRRRDWADLTLVSTLSPCSMCTGTAVLHGIKRVVIGENTTYMGAEHWLEEHGVDTLVLHDQRCIDLMTRFQNELPDLWAEDIGK